ncbi:hypothetical protein ACFYYD_16760 [Streptomyces bluensis]|uniref:hypothetical protein n=1 Tax=Streptomyces bluensis TaxID=33897 RepID=UPI00332EF1E9
MRYAHGGGLTPKEQEKRERHLADFAAADLTHLSHVIKRKLKKIQYRPHLIDGCLPPTGLTMGDDAIRPPDSMSST